MNHQDLYQLFAMVDYHGNIRVLPCPRVCTFSNHAKITLDMEYIVVKHMDKDQYEVVDLKRLGPSTDYFPSRAFADIDAAIMACLMGNIKSNKGEQT